MANLHLLIQRNPLVVDQGAVAAAEILQVVSAISEAYNSMTPRYHSVGNEHLTICKNKGVEDVEHLVVTIRAYGSPLQSHHVEAARSHLNQGGMRVKEPTKISMYAQGKP